MASSGWQSNQDFPYYHSDLKCNLRIDSITHTGTNLRVTGAIGALCTNNSSGWYGYFVYPVYVTPTGGGQQTLLSGNERVYGDGAGGYSTAKTVSFDVTIAGVAESSTTYGFGVYINMNNGQNSGTLYWTLNFDSSTPPSPTYSAPTGLAVSLTSHTWDSATGTVSITSYGNPPDAAGRYIEVGLIDSSSTVYLSSPRLLEHSTEGATSATLTVTNNSIAADGGYTIKGCKAFKFCGYATNIYAFSQVTGTTTYYFPPAPLTDISATETQGSTTVTLSITGGSSTDNESVTVETQYRYKVGSGSFSAWATAGTGTPWTTQTATISVAYGSEYTVQARQLYQGQYSEVMQRVFNSTARPPLYGSVNRLTTPLDPVYCSVSSKTRKLTKIYGSVGGKTVLIYTDGT